MIELVILVALFFISVVCVYRINTQKKEKTLHSILFFLGVGLIILSNDKMIPLFFFSFFTIWCALGFGLRRIGKFVSNMIDKLFMGSNYKQNSVHSDDYEDDAPETAMKLKFYVIALALYLFFIISVLPEIQL